MRVRLKFTAPDKSAITSTRLDWIEIGAKISFARIVKWITRVWSTQVKEEC